MGETLSSSAIDKILEEKEAERARVLAMQEEKRAQLTNQNKNKFRAVLDQQKLKKETEIAPAIRYEKAEEGESAKVPVASTGDKIEKKKAKLVRLAKELLDSKYQKGKNNISTMKEKEPLRFKIHKKRKFGLFKKKDEGFTSSAPGVSSLLREHFDNSPTEESAKDEALFSTPEPVEQKETILSTEEIKKFLLGDMQTSIKDYLDPSGNIKVKDGDFFLLNKDDKSPNSLRLTIRLTSSSGGNQIKIRGLFFNEGNGIAFKDDQFDVASVLTRQDLREIMDSFGTKIKKDIEFTTGKNVGKIEIEGGEVKANFEPSSSLDDLDPSERDTDPLVYPAGYTEPETPPEEKGFEVVSEEESKDSTKNPAELLEKLIGEELNRLEKLKETAEKDGLPNSVIHWTYEIKLLQTNPLEYFRQEKKRDKGNLQSALAHTGPKHPQKDYDNHVAGFQKRIAKWQAGIDAIKALSDQDKPETTLESSEPIEEDKYTAHKEIPRVLQAHIEKEKARILDQIKLGSIISYKGENYTIKEIPSNENENRYKIANASGTINYKLKKEELMGLIESGKAILETPISTEPKLERIMDEEVVEPTTETETEVALRKLEEIIAAATKRLAELDAEEVEEERLALLKRRKRRRQ